MVSQNNYFIFFLNYYYFFFSSSLLPLVMSLDVDLTSSGTGISNAMNMSMDAQKRRYGDKLYDKNPKQAPIIDPQKTEASPTPSI